MMKRTFLFPTGFWSTRAGFSPTKVRFWRATVGFGLARNRVWIAGAWSLILLIALTSCTGRAPDPDPLQSYRPAFRAEAAQSELRAALDAARLVRYDLTLRVDPAERKVIGVARITFHNRSGRPLNDLYVRLYPNLPQLVGGMRLTGVVTLPQRFAAGFAFAVENTAARITLTEPLPPDQSLTLEINYELGAPERTGYVLFGQSEGILSLPYAYPILASQTGDPAAPWRLDVPPQHGDIPTGEPALFWVTATIPSGFAMVSTGVEISRTERTPGWTDHIVVAGPVREWGLLVSRELQAATLEVEGVKINSYALPADVASGQAALAQAAAAMRVFQNLFGPYPFTELDVVETPTRYLGMEYPGLSYIGMDTYRTQRESQEFLVAHEIAHQWWYGIVGSDPFRYPWLDEGLAEHSSLLYIETLYGPERAAGIRNLRWQVPTDWAIANGFDNAVGQPVTAFDGNNYEILVYAKSALFFDALDQTLGRETYLNVLRTFIARYRYQTPTPEDFLQVVREVGGIDPQPLYEKWILTAAPAAGERFFAPTLAPPTVTPPAT